MSQEKRIRPNVTVLPNWAFPDSQGWAGAELSRPQACGSATGCATAPLDSQRGCAVLFTPADPTQGGDSEAQKQGDQAEDGRVNCKV